MTSFLIDENHLRRLSPSARRELLEVLSDDLAALRADYEVQDWDPEGNESYPLTADEAAVLIRGMPEPAIKALQVFAGDEQGRAELSQLLEATGYQWYQQLAEEFAWILLRLRTVTGDHDAWLLNWRTQDWVWDADSKTYSKGVYFISSEAINALRSAFGMT